MWVRVGRVDGRLQLFGCELMLIDCCSAPCCRRCRRNLRRETAWEAVMRIRCSKGLHIAAFFGHFFIRSTDLLALPACDSDKVRRCQLDGGGGWWWW